MADISVIIEVLGNKEIERATKSMSSLEGRVGTLRKAFKDGRIDEDQFKQGLKEIRRTIDSQFPSWQKAKAAIDRYNKSLERAEKSKAVEQATQDYRRLTAAIDPVERITQEYQRSVRTLDAALENNVITLDEYNQRLATVKGNMKNAGVTFNQYGEVANVNTRRLKRFSAVGLQQVGYQLGDFAVQVQSGTNVAVAFGQQMSQLLGIFGPAGAIAGAGVAIATAFIAPLIDAKKSAKDLNNEVQSLDETLKRYAQTQEALSKGLTFEEDVAQRALEKAKKDLQDIEDAFSGFKTGKISSQAYLTALVPFAEQLGLGPISQIEDAEAAIVKAKERVQKLTEKLNAENKKSLEDSIRLRKQELELARVEVEFGSDSIQYVETKNEQELKNLQIKLKQKAETGGITAEEQKLINAIISATKQQQKIREELAGSKSEAKGLADALRDAASAMSSLQSFGQGLERSLEIARAKAVAIKNETSEAVAGQVAGMRFDLEQRRQAAIEAGVDPIIAGAEAALSSITIDQLEKQRSENAAARQISKSGSSGGGKPDVDPMEKLLKQVSLNERLLGLSEARQQVLKALGDEASNYSQTQIDSVTQRIEAYNMEKQALEEAAAQQQSLADTLKNSMSDAFMSMVEGTKSFKDAMKDMARAVIKQLFDILVVQQLVGSFDAKTGTGSGIVGAIMGMFKDGAAFSKGKVTPFADGGVVGSPTVFPMANGMGLMGEAGPEAIMPLKRGKNGKLGVQAESSQQPVVINQSFNFQANGDESVKRIIAQEAPKIANLTQKQVLDQRARGGAFRTTFGG